MQAGCRGWCLPPVVAVAANGTLGRDGMFAKFSDVEVAVWPGTYRTVRRAVAHRDMHVEESKLLRELPQRLPIVR